MKLTLTTAEHDDVSALADEVLAGNQPWEPLTLAHRTGTLAQRLPLRLREFLATARAEEPKVIVVSNLPVRADLEPTPNGWELAAKSQAGLREEIVLLLCGSALGEPFGWRDQQDGRIVHDVCPAPGMENSLTSGSSELMLALHTEDVFHPCRCDYVSLFCLRNPGAVGTTYVPVDAVELTESQRAVLGERRFRFYPDDSHVGPNDVRNDERDDEPDGRRSRRHWVDRVLFGAEEKPYLRVDVDFSEAVEGDPEAARAMDALVVELGTSTRRLALQPGDALFLDNYQSVHGREPFNPRYDGTDRWLKRLNLIRDERRIYIDTGSRSRIIA